MAAQTALARLVLWALQLSGAVLAQNTVWLVLDNTAAGYGTSGSFNPPLTELSATLRGWTLALDTLLSSATCPIMKNTPGKSLLTSVPKASRRGKEQRCQHSATPRGHHPAGQRDQLGVGVSVSSASACRRIPIRRGALMISWSSDLEPVDPNAVPLLPLSSEQVCHPTAVHAFGSACSGAAPSNA